MKDYIVYTGDVNKGEQYTAKLNGLEYRIWYCRDFWQTAQLKNGYFCNHKPFKHHFVKEIPVKPGNGTIMEYDSNKSFSEAIKYIEETLEKT